MYNSLVSDFVQYLCMLVLYMLQWVNHWRRKGPQSLRLSWKPGVKEILLSLLLLGIINAHIATEYEEEKQHAHVLLKPPRSS